MSLYPGTLDSFPTREAHVDLYRAAHVNALQQAVVAVETELGTDPAGSLTDLKTRLAVSLNNDGTLKTDTVGDDQITNMTRLCFQPAYHGNQPHGQYLGFPSIPLRDGYSDAAYLLLYTPADLLSVLHAYMLCGADGSGNVYLYAASYHTTIGSPLNSNFQEISNTAFPLTSETLYAWDIAANFSGASQSELLNIQLYRYGAQGTDTLTETLHIFGTFLEYTAKR